MNALVLGFLIVAGIAVTVWIMSIEMVRGALLLATGFIGMTGLMLGGVYLIIEGTTCDSVLLVSVGFGACGYSGLYFYGVLKRCGLFKHLSYEGPDPTNAGIAVLLLVSGLGIIMLLLLPLIIHGNR